MTSTYLARPEEVTRLQAAGYRAVCEAQGGRTLMSLSPAATAQNGERAALAQELEAARRELAAARSRIAELQREVEALRGAAGEPPRGAPALKWVLDAVAAAWGVEARELRAPGRPGSADGRHAIVNHARSAYYLLSRERTGCSTNEIARHLGRSDHTTVTKGAAMGRRRLAADIDFAARLSSAREQLP